MTSRSRILIVLASIAALALLSFAGVAQASPAGDDDLPYGTQGTAFNTLDGLENPKPVTGVDASDGSSVTAVVESPDNDFLRLTRYDSTGKRVDFSGTGGFDLGGGPGIDDLLDLRVVGGMIEVLARSDDDQLLVYTFGSDGTLISSGPANYAKPEACESDDGTGTGTDTETATDSAAAPTPSLTDEPKVIRQDFGYVDAARVTASGGVYALWDCYANKSDTGESNTVVARYAPATNTTAEEVDKAVDYEYGDDLELGPDGRPYVLGLFADDAAESRVYRLSLDLSTVDTASDSVDGYPVDLAVDSTGRAIVWTNPEEEDTFISALKGGSTKAGPGDPETWYISRLSASDLTTDTSWGANGLTTVTDGRLGEVYGGTTTEDRGDEFLTVRPGDKVLVTGGRFDENGDEIVGLTSQGQLDTTWATNGFKDFVFNSDDNRADYFERIGEPKLQADGKVLVPFTTQNYSQEEPVGLAAASPRIARPTTDGDPSVGVTRLNPDPTTSTPVSAPPPPAPARPVTPSSVPAICGRRAISLVRADVKGRKVKLQGLVGSKLFGKKVVIAVDLKRGAKASKFSKLTTVKAGKTGTFTATVKRPPRADFVTARYRATSGGSVSPQLKLPQSLVSRSVKSAAGTITVKGRVKRSVLGKRKKVLIRRLVCGRYRTVGSAKPSANGSYTVKFKATAFRGVAFYRAEAKVLRKPKSKHYVTQYARALAIKVTSQTG